MLRLPRFRYHSPRDVAEAVGVKGELGSRAAYVAGGTNLFPGMKRRQHEPEVVIPVDGLSEMRGHGAADGGFRLGSGLTLAEIAAAPMIRDGWPALAEAAGRVATPLVRNLATLGGNLCLDTRCSFYDRSHEWREAINFCLKKEGDLCRVASSSKRCWAIQASDLSALVIALDAHLELAGPQGTRSLAASEFYNDDGVRYLNKHPDELVTGVLLPVPGRGESAFVKVSRRVSFDFPVLAVAVWVRREDRDAEISEARVVLGAVGSAPAPVPEAGKALIGRRLDPRAIEDAAEAAWSAVRPLDNADQAGLWRKRMVRPYVTRALQQLVARARGSATAGGSRPERNPNS